MASGKTARKVGLCVLIVIGLLTIGLFTTSAGKAVRDIWGSGAVGAIVNKPPDRTYDASSSEENLKSLATALKLYHESEGQFPDAAKWMDQIAPRLILNDLPKKEAEKKLVRPGVGSGEFGYAINDAASGKYRDDLPKGTVLIYESVSIGRNAHGDPKKDGVRGGRALTIEGTIVSLAK